MTYPIENIDHCPARVTLEAAIGERFHYWYGASGQSYLHTIFAVGACPSLANASYIAVYRDAHGHRHVLETGLLMERSQELNAIRRPKNTAFAGANEIHLHLLANSRQEAKAIIDDLNNRHTRAKPLVN